MPADPPPEALHFTTEPMSVILPALQAALEAAPTVHFTAPDPDLGVGRYAGEVTPAGRHRAWGTWVDLADLLGAHLLTPVSLPGGRVRLGLRRWAQAPDPDAGGYGPGGAWGRVDKLEDPVFLFTLQEALRRVAPPPGGRVLALGVNAGRELDALALTFPDRALHVTGLDLDPEAVVAFRGTEGVSMPWLVPNRAKASGDAVESVRDTVVGDMNALGPGYGQYRPNRDLVRVQLKHAGQRGRVVSTGHSLGGALAQIVGADNPEFVDTVVSFAAPGIDKDDVKRLREWNDRHEGQEVAARHYRVSGDIVPGSGEARLDGQVFTFDRYVTTRERGAEVFRTDNGFAAQNAHNAFVLRDFVARIPARDLDDVQRAVVQYGGVDKMALSSGQFDPSYVTTMVLNSLDQARHDPNIQTELARKYATPFIYSVATVHRLLQDLPYEVLMDRTDKQLAKVSADQVRKAGGLTKALDGLRKKILATESVILTMEDVKFFAMLDRDDLVSLGAFQAAFDVPRPVKVRDRDAIARALNARWRYWHPGAEDVK